METRKQRYFKVRSTKLCFWTKRDVQSYDPADENYQIQKGIKIGHLFPQEMNLFQNFITIEWDKELSKLNLTG